MSTTVRDPARQSQVQVHFFTGAPDIELPEGKRQLLIPTSMNSMNQIAYHILITGFRRSKIWPLSDFEFRVYA